MVWRRGDKRARLLVIFQVPHRRIIGAALVSPSSPIDHNLDHLADLALWEAELALDSTGTESAPESVEVESALVKRLRKLVDLRQVATQSFGCECRRQVDGPHLLTVCDEHEIDQVAKPGYWDDPGGSPQSPSPCRQWNPRVDTAGTSA